MSGLQELQDNLNFIIALLIGVVAVYLRSVLGDVRKKLDKVEDSLTKRFVDIDELQGRLDNEARLESTMTTDKLVQEAEEELDRMREETTLPANASPEKDDDGKA